MGHRVKFIDKKKGKQFPRKESIYDYKVYEHNAKTIRSFNRKNTCF